MWVSAFEPNQWVAKQDESTWLWALSPLDDQHTRLVTRLRVRYTWTPPWVFYYLLQDVGDIVMMRKSMLGIKRRAEAMGAQPPER
jgi:hypothetical protein